MPRILCVFPRYAPSFGTFDYARHLVGARGFMPPQGLLLVAAYLPGTWDVRFVDENLSPVTEEALEWADVVLLSGMHVQRGHIEALNHRAHEHGCLTVLGGPSVSACPEWYPTVDVLHVGELGDATDLLVDRLDRGTERPPRQEVYRTVERLPLERFPVPAYHLVDVSGYLHSSVQFSSGCPYRCEFCDIPELYGRNPRLKTPRQVTRELDAIIANGGRDLVYFVDDNFIGNPHATTALLEELIRWQRNRGYPIDFACEATLNIAHRSDILEAMREARFVTLFCGIETPEDDALMAMNKRHNVRSPILDAIHTVNSFGIEVVSGIIMGLDTDTDRTAGAIKQFVDTSGIPILTINLLHALPQTPLWRRLEAEGRLLESPGTRQSNVEFLRPYNDVVDAWRTVISHAYEPARVFERYARQVSTTWPHRKPVPKHSPRGSRANVVRGLRVAARVTWEVGIRADYRRPFWRLVTDAVRARQPEAAVQGAIVSHHLVRYAREAVAGRASKAFYAPTTAVPSPPRPGRHLPERVITDAG